MSICLTQIAGIAALVPALQFGQVSNVLEIRDATKDAFQATSKALDSIEANRAKGKPQAGQPASSPARNSSAAASGSGTLFSKLGARAEKAETSGALQQADGPSEREQKLLSFLDSSSDLVFQIMLGVVGIAVAWCVGVRIKEKLRDVTTGRPSLSKCRIVRR
jgi:hypothetical protein